MPACQNPSDPATRKQRIHGKRFALFRVDPETDSAQALCMGKSRDWLLIRASKILFPQVVEIDAAEATAIARAGVLEIDDWTVKTLAMLCYVSKPTMAAALKAVAEEDAAARAAR